MKTLTQSNSLSKAVRCFLFTFILFTFSTLNIFADKIISGVITASSDKSAIPGVSVILKGTTNGCISDLNGKYEIAVPDSGAILIFQFIGYKKQEIATNSQQIINISLDEDVVSLNEVVVIGYGVQKKSMVTGSICSIAPSPATYFNPSTESYSKINENGFKDAQTSPLSTFSIDVDKASYSNMRRFITTGSLPPADAVRTEELINYFSYNYPQPTDNHPFSINTELTNCPWENQHKLLRIGLQGKKIATENLPASNLVFLIDVSGSMGEANKLPLVISAFKLLVNNLREKDHVAIVVYAGAAGVVLPSTKGSDKNKILEALNSLHSGGSTAGCEGIELAYKIAKENFIKKGNNRIILATDGDFNVGLSNENELENFITKKRNEGIYLTCLGFGMSNYKDSKIEILSDKGNGNYAYIDDMVEANKVFVNEFGGTLFTIAKDVKIQIEFNPAIVQSYRLIGYENRLLNNEDFKDDTKDAGELGSGHTVTALYEIIPVGVNSNFAPLSDSLKYQARKINKLSDNEEFATIKFRYKKPDGTKSIEMIHTIANLTQNFNKASENTRFAASIAMYGMLLTNSKFKGNSNYTDLIQLAKSAKGTDEEGYRSEFIRLANTAKELSLNTTATIDELEEVED
jgi:Ca-activated chloride channel family protein